jgi:uncharacterized phage protein (TIGR02220 family)
MYGVIDCSFWNDRRFQGVTGHVREALLYLLSSPHINHIGCYRISPEYMALDLEWTADDARAAIRDLQKIGLVKYDWEQEVVFVPLYAKWNPLNRGNMDKAACSDAKNLPPSPLVYEWVILMRTMYPGFKAMLDEVEADANGKSIPTVYQQSLEIDGAVSQEREGTVGTVSGQCIDTVGTVAGKGRVREGIGVVRTDARAREDGGALKLETPSIDSRADEVIDYLNASMNPPGRFRHSPASRQHILARLKDGGTVDDCKMIVDVKAAEWGGDPQWESKLRPKTLFTPEHFESYLNEAVRWIEQGRPRIGRNGKDKTQESLDNIAEWLHDKEAQRGKRESGSGGNGDGGNGIGAEVLQGGDGDLEPSPSAAV